MEQAMQIEMEGGRMMNMEDQRALIDAINRLKDCHGMSYKRVADEAGMSRPTVSNLVNQGLFPNSDKVEALWNVVRRVEAEAKQVELESEELHGPIKKYRQTIGLYETAEFMEALGWCRLVVKKRKMGVLVGHPGTGKTTIIKSFMKRQPGVIYIEAWPNMRTGDMLMEIGSACGISLSGNNYSKEKQLIAALRSRQDIAIAVDEAEYLGKWDVDKFEILRKIWDNTGTPVILIGTGRLEEMLVRGGGHHNLAQIYRRKIEIKLNGITGKEARDILREYNITADVTEALVKVALDVRHGGMGNFVELLDLCLEAAEGRQIDMSVYQSAKHYKLMY